jgi:alpha-tubulin suppressor-like RCC1 family protein
LVDQAKLLFPESVIPDGGIDSIGFDAVQHEFMLAVTKTAKYTNGAIYAIDAESRQVVHKYAISVPCNPSGVTAVSSMATVAVACAANNSLILHFNGDTARSIAVDRASGTDSAEYWNGFYFFAGGTHLTVANPDGKMVQQITVGTNSHNVIVDRSTGKVYVPQRGFGLVAYSAQ